VETPRPSTLVADWRRTKGRAQGSFWRAPSGAVGVSRWVGACALASEDRKGGGPAAARAPGTCAPQTARISRKRSAAGTGARVPVWRQGS
jgi:hypothetical protein